MNLTRLYKSREELGGGRGVGEESFMRDRIVTFELVWFGRFPQCSGIWLYTRLLICGRNFQAQRPAKKFKLGLLFSSLDLGRLLKQLSLKWRSKEPIKVIKSCPTHDKSGMVFNKYFHSARNVILFLIRVIFALWHKKLLLCIRTLETSRQYDMSHQTMKPSLLPHQPTPSPRYKLIVGFLFLFFFPFFFVKRF